MHMRTFFKSLYLFVFSVRHPVAKIIDRQTCHLYNLVEWGLEIYSLHVSREIEAERERERERT